MSQPESQRLTVGRDTFIVKFAGPYSHQGETLWFAKSVIARDKDDRVTAGDAHIGSPGYQVACLNGTGGTPDDAYRDLEDRLAKLKSHEF
jgi:hypothetical protein